MIFFFFIVHQLYFPVIFHKVFAKITISFTSYTVKVSVISKLRAWGALHHDEVVKIENEHSKYSFFPKSWKWKTWLYLKGNYILLEIHPFFTEPWLWQVSPKISPGTVHQKACQLRLPTSNFWAFLSFALLRHSRSLWMDLESPTHPTSPGMTVLRILEL